MRPGRTQRQAAVLFAAIGFPAILAIVHAGGALALAPLLLLVLPLITIGRAPGIEALERVRVRLARRPRRRPATLTPPALRPGSFAPRTSLALAYRLAERGPPAAPAIS